jgi:hypothetical protein
VKDISEILTIGLPFCVFKVVTGMHLNAFPLASGVLVGLGILDTVINLGNLATLLLKKCRVLPVCTLTGITEWTLRKRPFASEKRMDLGNSIDMAVALLLVAAMVGFEQIASLPTGHILAWNVAVVLNVLGAGLSRLNHSVRQLNT